MCAPPRRCFVFFLFHAARSFFPAGAADDQEADASEDQHTGKHLAERQLLMQEDRTDHNASQRLKHAQNRAQPRPGILHAVLQEDRSTDVIQEGDQRNDPEIRQDAPKLQRRGQRARRLGPQRP